jgi:FMN-dependent oxidoreductase (nitrilotriacetate monooxygenase family)
MSGRDDQMHLAAVLSPAGSHMAGWRHPDAAADGVFNVRRYQEAARIAEDAKFDLIFLADSLGLKDAPLDAVSQSTHFTVCLDPAMVLASVAEHTRHIGLVATSSTTYNEPFNLARRFATLDLMSGGRAGWNMVTSTQQAEARNFQAGAHADHRDRYRRAGEFVDVVKGLWDSMEDGAVVLDKATAQVFDPARMHRLNHEGEVFSVRGPLTSARPPQGHPVIFQAGSSEPGRELAARTADCIFTAQPTLEGACAFYRDVKSRLARYGREPDDLKILPALFPIVGETEDQAKAKLQALQELVPPAAGIHLLSVVLGGKVDLSQYPLDEPPPALPQTDGSRTVQTALLDQARRENLTLRQLYLRYAVGFGNRSVAGTPSQVADLMQETFEAHGCDGLAISCAMLPGSLKDFAQMVVPELQRRGLFRTTYPGTTLRETLGLRRPPHPALKRKADADPRA